MYSVGRRIQSNLLQTDRILNWLHSTCTCLLKDLLDSKLQDGRLCIAMIYHGFPRHKGTGIAWGKFVQLHCYKSDVAR